jgi:hypothetical protein
MMWRVWWRAVVIVLGLHTFCVCPKGQNLLHTKRESPANAPINRPRAFSGGSRTPVLPKAAEPAPHAQPDPAKYARAYLKLPLDFEANRGQAPERYAFISHGPGYALALAPDGVDLALHRTSPQAASPQTRTLNVIDALAAPAPTANLRLSLVEAAHQVQVTGVDALPGRSNYFIGNDPGKWRTQVPHYRSIRMAGIYPGIDLLFYGNPQELEYDFVVAPGSDPGLIRLGITGADRVALDGAGNARLTTAAGEVELKQPVAYQEIAGKRVTVESHFRLGAAAQISFELGDYDHTAPLVIDPVLAYSVVVDGNLGAQPVGMAVDSNGNAYITGNTCSTDFPSTSGPLQSNHGGFQNNCEDVFVTKFDATASTLVFSDFIGGSQVDTGMHLALDSQGNVFVVGSTNSPDFPTVNNIGKTTPPAHCSLVSVGLPCPDGFVAKLSPDGSSLLFSMLLGGSQADAAFNVKINAQTGDVVVLGVTNSADFVPALHGPEAFSGGTCANSNPCFDIYVLALAPDTGALRYGTFLGGNANDFASGLALDNAGAIYIAGSTQNPQSSGLPTPTHLYPPSNSAAAGGADILVAKFVPPSTFSYITVIQGENDDAAAGIAVNPVTGEAFIIGTTNSPHLATTAGVFDTTYQPPTSNTSCLWMPGGEMFLPNGCGNSVIAKLDASGALSFLTLLGAAGAGPDAGAAIALDGNGNLWLAGFTGSPNFPVSSDAYYSPSSTVFFFSSGYLAEMSSDGKSLPFATAINSTYATPTDIAIDSNNNIYLTGTADTTIPQTPGAYLFDNATSPAAFLQKWTQSSQQPKVQLSGTSLTFPDEPIGVASPVQSVTLTNVGTGPMQVGVSLGTALGGFASELQDFAESDNCPASLAAGAFCTINAFFQPQPPTQFVSTGRAANLLIRTNAPGAPHAVALSGNTGQGPIISFQPNPVVFPTQPAGQASQLLPVDVYNGGDMNLNIANIAVTGPNASEFTVIVANSPSGHPCDQPVFATGSCEFQVQFTPAANATGTRTATLMFTDTAASSPQSLVVSGTVGSGPILNLSPTTFSLSVAAIGTTNPPSQIVTLSNPSATGIQVTALTLGGANVGDFGVQSGSCNATNPPPFTVAAGASCFVIVSFTPLQPPAGLRQGTLAIITNPALALPTVTFSGPAVTNTDPSIDDLFLVPYPMDFGAVAIGQSTNSGSHIFEFTNQSPIPCSGGAPSCGGPLNVSAITTGTSQYTLSSTPVCTPPFVLPSGSGFCQYFVVFTPTASGPQNGLLSIVSNAPQGTVTFPLTGSGLAITKVQVLPGMLQFGSTAIGVTSPPLPVVLQNIGNASFSVASAVASGMFSAQLGDCNQPVLPGQLCTLMVTFTPNAAGNSSGVLTITDNGWGGQQFATLSGSGGSGPALLLIPSHLDLGTVDVGKTSPAKTIQILSTGDTPVTVLGSLANGDFLLAGQNCPATLTRGQSCTAQVQFKPTLPFQESGSLLVTSNAQGSPQVAVLTGSGVQPGSTASTTTLGLSPNPVNQGQAVTLTATVTGQSFTPTGTVSFADNGVALSSGALDNTGKASFTTSFNGGTFPLSASYLGDSTYAASNSAIVKLVVNPLLSLSPMSWFFGTQLLATPSAAGTITLANNSGSPLTISSIAVAGSNSSDFSVKDNCPISPNTVAAGNGCTIHATFTPQAAGPRKSSISISDNSGSGVQTILLTGVGAAINTAPSSLTFNSQQVGTPSTAQAVTITNEGSTVVNLWQITFLGANAGDFSKSNTSTCGSSLGAGANCAVNVIFTPAAAGSRTASLLISNDGGGSPQAVTLTGAGTSGPAARLSTSAVIFGEQAVGTSSHGEMVVLTNAGDGPLAVGNLTISGASGGDFVQTSTCGASLAAGASCTIEIKFAPRAMGTRTAVINVLRFGSLPLKVQGTGIGREPRPMRETE